ncbi:MAG: hypothetical protein Q8P26_05665 [Candidatus Levybacteria bacterium]|nr:hypothetical protein [Candidatus Levybacteria bacterium]MDZ4228398.1 hypothetical protein [Candidatus Levybacteria bacterium]
MNDDSILGATLGQVGLTAKKVGQSVAKLPIEMSKDMGEQLGGQNDEQAVSAKSDLISSEPQWKSDEERVQFLKGLYGPSSAKQNSEEQKPAENKQTTSANPLVSAVEDKKPSEFQEQIKDKSPEEQKELMALRNQLHREVYYDPTFNPPKNPPAGGEERPAEKVEKEKKQEMAELEQKKAKKPQALAVHREQNKTEMFRGVSG